MTYLTSGPVAGFLSVSGPSEPPGSGPTRDLPSPESQVVTRDVYLSGMQTPYLLIIFTKVFTTVRVKITVTRLLRLKLSCRNGEGRNLLSTIM